jgi:hypothetical protein
MTSQDGLFTSLKLVQLDHLVQNVAELAYDGLQQLTTRLPAEPDAERRRLLLENLHATRQRLQRLDVLLQWCNKAPAVAESCGVLQVAAAHSAAFRDAADQLAFLYAELEDLKAPPYDVPSAALVLQTGEKCSLPCFDSSTRWKGGSNVLVDCCQEIGWKEGQSRIL